MQKKLRTNLAQRHKLARLRATGFSLLEVLISLVVLSVGLLGMAGLMSTTVKSNDSAYMTSQANALAYNIIDRMRTNASGLQAGDYSVPMPAAPSTATREPASCTGTSCSTSDLATYDIDQWQYDLAHKLPQGRGSVAPTASSGVYAITIKVLWNDERANRALNGTAAPANSSLSVTTILNPATN